MVTAAERLLHDVRRRGGIARSAEMVRGGADPKLIAGCVAAGSLRRVRRVWVAVPEADRQLVEAAQKGVDSPCRSTAATTSAPSARRT